MSPSSSSPADAAWMELAVAGELGPVLRSALRSDVVAHATPCTVLRLGAPADMDVLAVMEALDSQGLQVTSVRCVAGGGRSPRDPGDG